MAEDILKTAYDPARFREAGHALIDQLARYLQEARKGQVPVLHYQHPDKEWDLWQAYLEKGDPKDLFERILERTTKVQHPRYMGHQVAPPIPLASLAALVGGVLNNGMAIYEMGMAPTAMERLLTDWLCRKAGFGPEARGFLTSGGTLANLTALLAARRSRGREDVWNKGYTSKQAVLVSEAAHYCIDRAARIMGMGAEGVIQIPVDTNYRMDPAYLQQAYDQAIKKGLEPIALVGSAPCTATGSYDPLEPLAAFCRQHNLWFHIDGAHGGAAILSERYKHLMDGVAGADSLVIDGHKMMGMPVLTTALLFRNGADSYNTFSQQADYLLSESEEEDWYNGAKRTFECTKLTGIFSWFAVWKTYGEELFTAYLERQYDLAREASELIRSRPGWELACLPQSNILCFRYLAPGMDDTTADQLNGAIRQHLLEAGTYYIVQTRVSGRSYLRTSLMNPLTGISDIRSLLDHIEGIAKAIPLSGN
ncbi:pyridoxal phosphate-dependent decarboxylase family protein [Robiginitalea sediminis]|uniref:pyridoxal phosphate-dependent decarboxylase family protein n=1 Tax=Robiginitalea sediminis TaxID=1982593 RepID=UPI000B4B5377|nr:aminotransferase class I/II-fold pyridoxal phosphate-dependent enzyme [Robiginitalea sediminis]